MLSMIQYSIAVTISHDLVFDNLFLNSGKERTVHWYKSNKDNDLRVRRAERTRGGQRADTFRTPDASHGQHFSGCKGQ